MAAQRDRKHHSAALRLASPPFRDPDALIKAWESLRGQESLRPHLEPLADLLIESAGAAAEPDQAFIQFIRLLEGSDNPAETLTMLSRHLDRLPYLVRLLGDSALLSEYVILHPASIERDFFSVDLDRPAGIEERRRVLQESLTLMGPGDLYGVLRRFKQREIFLIGARDLLRIPPVEEVTQELTDLAEVILDASLAEAFRSLADRFGLPMTTPNVGKTRPAAFSVMAMGKLAGRELNFSSDIDLMFVYDEEGETLGGPPPNGAAPIPNHAFFTKLSEELVRILGEITEDGHCYRIDLGLRPEGRSGALARSLYNYEVYYESWGSTWERQALIKCRPVAGDQGLGRRFVEMVQPFVYRKYLDFASLSEIKQMKERIDRHVDQRGEAERQVKLGRGGIREIEFVVQSLQLIHGGRIPAVRERNTLAALRGLEHHGLLSGDEARTLGEAYRFLRSVEHRVQIVHGAQTHLLPRNPEQLLALARRLGLGTVDALMALYQRRTQDVRRIFENLFYQPDDSTSASVVPEETSMILGREIDNAQARRVFDRYGIRDPEKACRNLMLLLEGQESRPLITPKARALLANLMPDLLKGIASSPDPDMAFDHLERFLAESGSRDLYLRTLGENPKVMELLTELFGTSVFLSTILIKNPGLFERFTRSGYLERPKTARQFERELARARVSGRTFDQRFLDVFRYKKEEIFRIGLRDILEFADLPDVTAELTALAEGVLSRILTLCRSAAGGGRSGGRAGGRLAIIGMGKLGGREMNYGSDLDILFVHAPSAQGEDEEGPLIHRLAEQVMEAVSRAGEEGILYRIDTRLRPFGSTGVLTQTVDAYRAYFQEHAQTWERQALIKARPVAGDPSLGSSFMEEVERFTYGYGLLKTESRAIAEMRERLATEREAIQPGEFHLKLSRGGIVDVEFSVQKLQLRHGHDHPEVRNPKTMQALDALVRAGLLSKRDQAALRTGYLFLRRVENRLRILRDASDDVITLEPGALEPLARRLGYERDSGARLLTDIEANRSMVERASRRIIEKT